MTESAIKEVFIGGAEDIIEKPGSGLIQLEENAGDEEIINRIFRFFHTLKGSPGIVGLATIHDYSHKLENLLDQVRSGNASVDRCRRSSNQCSQGKGDVIYFRGGTCYPGAAV
jgi:chemotaxis protein histidine kinase CheA